MFKVYSHKNHNNEILETNNALITNVLLAWTLYAYFSHFLTVRTKKAVFVFFVPTHFSILCVHISYIPAYTCPDGLHICVAPLHSLRSTGVSPAAQCSLLRIDNVRTFSCSHASLLLTRKARYILNGRKVGGRCTLQPSVPFHLVRLHAFSASAEPPFCVLSPSIWLNA